MATNQTLTDIDATTAEMASMHRRDLALFQRQHETLRSMVSAYNILVAAVPGLAGVDFEEPAFDSPPDPLAALIDAAVAAGGLTTNEGLKDALRGVSDASELSALTAAQFGALVPLLTTWLASERDVASGFTLLHEGVRVFSDELLPARHMRSDWRRVTGVLSDLLEAPGGVCGVDEAGVVALLQHIKSRSGV